MKLAAAIVFAMAFRPQAPPTPPEPPTLTHREALVEVALSQVGVQEATGKNDGTEVEAYLRTTGLGKGFAWCAAFVAWCGVETELLHGKPNPYPVSAWSPTFGAGGTRDIDQARPADTFQIYYRSKKRIGHVGIVESTTGSTIITIEGNTSSTAALGSAADREGQGVYRKRRPKIGIYSVTDHLSK